MLSDLPEPPISPENLFACLDRLGIVTKTIRHQPLFTVQESQALRGEIPGGHVKNLFLKDKKGVLFLVVTLEDAVIDLKSLHRRLGATGRFSFASADQMRDILGVEPGSATPFAVANDRACRVTLVLDASLMEHSVINCHPLINTMTTSIGRDGLLRFLDAAEHPPRIVAVTGEAEPDSP